MILACSCRQAPFDKAVTASTLAQMTMSTQTGTVVLVVHPWACPVLKPPRSLAPANVLLTPTALWACPAATIRTSSRSSTTTKVLILVEAVIPWPTTPMASAQLHQV